MISAELTYISHCSIVLQQNNVKILRELKLKNSSGAPLERLHISITSSPALTIPFDFDVARLDEELSLNDLDLRLDYDSLAALTDAVNGTLTLTISQDGNTLLSEEHPITGHAPDQWLGQGIIPETLASFVCPNMEATGAIMTLVANELQKTTGDSSISGYNDGKQRAYEIVKATFNAIHSLGISYARAVMDINQIGQRIRMPDYIFKYRHANCLDTTILMASVLEACNLYPVILLTKGHAYIGCHLNDESFSDLPMDDLQKIRKLCSMDEFIVCETTLSEDSSASFESAEILARDQHLLDDDFECAIDVRRARESGIRPLPFKSTLDGITFDEGLLRSYETVEVETRELQQSVDLSSLPTAQSNGRTDSWKKKLLDFSLRNRLLNVRKSAQVITIASSDISSLEDALSSNAVLSIGSIYDLLAEKDINELSQKQVLDPVLQFKPLLDSELAQKRIWAMHKSNELKNNLTKIFRQGKTDLEEGGINTLFLAIGALEWKVTERDKTSMLAPLLLMPVKLIRNSVREPYKLQRLEDDLSLNHTLAEMLNREFKLNVPLGEELPKDEHGVDVKNILQIFREVIKDMKGWEVHEWTSVGLFSFAKYNMWYDMAKRSDQLLANPLVKHLADGGGSYDDGVEVFPPEELAEHLDLSKIYCPMSADSSQLTAVLYSAMGKSFVLHGPPGTGKSQTITNIIAHNLALGRRVLFVSEKKAALDVVHRRLSQVGLRPFCLELHSNKSAKNEVYAQFNEVLSLADAQEPQEWSTTIDALSKTRDELNDYVSVLHHKYPNGISAYDCFARLIGIKAKPLSISIDTLAQTQEELSSVRSSISELCTSAKRIDIRQLSFFNLLAPADWSPTYQKEVLDSTAALSDSIKELTDALDSLEPFGMPQLNSFVQLRGFGKLIPMLKAPIPSVFFTQELLAKVDFLESCIGNAERLAALRSELASFDLDKVNDMDLGAIERRIADNNAKFFISKWLSNRTLAKELSPIKKLGAGALSIGELERNLSKFKQYKNMLQAYDADAPTAKQLLGDLWNNQPEECARILECLNATKTIYAAIQSFAGIGTDCCLGILDALQQIMPSLDSNRPLLDSVASAIGNFESFLSAFKPYSNEKHMPKDISELDFKLAKLQEHSAELRNALIYLLCKDKAEKCGLASIVFALENATIAPDGLFSAFDDALHNNMLNRILETVPQLSKFAGLTHEEKIRKFRQLDNRYINLTRHCIKAMLTSKLPRRRLSDCPEGTELGLLQREIKKKARQMAIKELLARIKSLLPSIKPCFLMSPLSVAQYLPLESTQFDLVVFDEASQIPVWDAIGTIARGKQLIVVGDPKQMPPTNFFQKNTSADEDLPPEEDEDMESILDECLASGMFSSYLSWHYRSRHESLIAFSNHYYYEDKLFTFPSASRSSKLGISFHKVENAIYDRKHSRTNAVEADALVDFVFELLHNPETQDKSIGIVTFSQAQKELIEDKIEERRMKDTSVEQYFSDESDEPLFVKNLENVQGDERDIIIFSICYAKDENGQFAMNFGPLNRVGGERRLNVAITRAKEQVVVFSSIDASMIDLGRTQAVGSSHLKFFLDYAQKGTVPMVTRAQNTAQHDRFLDTVAQVIEKNGYSVTRSVGCSGFKIDIAVSSDDNPDSYIAGIITDGYCYSNHKTARDRDNTMDSVLSSLGWKLIHIWSMDWAFDRAHAEQELLTAIRTEPQKNSPKQDAPIESSIGAPPPLPPQNNAQDEFPEYKVWAEKIRNVTDFTEPRNQDKIRRNIAAIIETEAPVRESVVKKRLFHAWNIARTTPQILATYRQLLPQSQTTEDCGGTVYWGSGNPAAFDSFRVPGLSPDSRRAIDEIPAPEIQAAFRYILKDFNGCPDDVLFRETVRLFGYNSLTEKMRNYLSGIKGQG